MDLLSKLEESVKYEYSKSRSLIHIPGDMDKSMAVAVEACQSAPHLYPIVAELPCMNEIQQMCYVISLLESAMKLRASTSTREDYLTSLLDVKPKVETTTLTQCYAIWSDLNRENAKRGWDWYFIWRLGAPDATWFMWRPTLFTLLGDRVKQIVLEPEKYLRLGITSCYSGVTVWPSGLQSA